MTSTAKNEANALEAENARLETEMKNLEVEDEFVPNDDSVIEVEVIISGTSS